MALSANNDQFREFEDGIAHLAESRWANAADSLRKAARREPARFAVVRALATACLQLGDPQAAREAVAALTTNSPMCAKGWRLAAQLEWKLGRYDDAMSVLARGLEHLPNSQTLHRQTSLFWGARGKVEAAACHAERAGQNTESQSRKIGPTPASQPESWTAQAVEADWLDQVAQDAKLLESVLNTPGVETNPEMLKGLESRLAALLESQPYHADRQLGLALLQVKVGSLPAAMLSVQRSLRANPGYVEAHRLRATILGEMGEFEEAIEVLEALIGRGMDWADIHFQVAELQDKRGRGEEARSHLYSAIRLNPGFERARQMLERVAA
jgi:tetratricopeptide (TPR) repeat protein